MKLPRDLRGQRICVAVSGGADSVVLLHKLRAEQKERGFSLAVVHCEHGIRGDESLADRDFVRELCRVWGITESYFYAEDCVSLSKETGQSLETAAREFRYRVFTKILESGQADYIALAHHENDEAETVLFRLARGSALAGAAAMKEKNGKFLRPLLDETKEEILAYAKVNGLTFHEDRTNAERSATRNVLRLDVLPALEQAVPGAKSNLARFARLAAEDEELLGELARPFVQTVERISTDDTGVRVLYTAKQSLLKRAALSAFKAIGITEDYTYVLIESVAALFDKQTGAEVSLPKGLKAVRSYDTVAFFKEEKMERRLGAIEYLEGEFSYGRYEIRVSETPTGEEGELRFDGDKIPRGAVVRTREKGDTFRKFGGGNKSLKKYLIDCKIPAVLRDGLPLIAYGKEILCVVGVEIAETVKVTDKTVKTRYITAKKK